MGEGAEPPDGAGQGQGPAWPGWTGVVADTAWEDPPRRPSASAQPPVPVLHLDGFDGPMDLLLDLAERHRIDLGRMSVLAIAEQFVAEMERLAPTVPLELRADWLVLATRLVLLRSRLMLAASPEEARAAERDADVELRRLHEMAFLRRAAAWLGARPLLGIDVLARPHPETPKREGGYAALMEACLAVLRAETAQRDEGVQVYRPVIPDLWRVADALARVRASLLAQPDGGEMGRFVPLIAADAPHRATKARAAVASTLLAGLELARLGEAEVTQEQTWGAVHLRAVGEGNDAHRVVD